MSDMLSIGASGLRSYQTALTTTSENIANAGTAGYARRTANLGEVVAATGMGTTSTNGLGVVVTGITRSGENYRSVQVRNADADLSRTQTSSIWLERLEGALTGNQLGDRLTAFFNAGKAVAADPEALAPRATMLESAATLAGAFSATGAALDAAANDLDAQAESYATRLNDLSAALGKVNSGLGRVSAGTSGQAALMDERDRLLGEMAKISGMDVTLDTAGRATVRAGGEGGPLLVQGDLAGMVTYVRNEEGAVSLAVHRAGETSAMVPNVGALAGIAEGAQRIAAARTAIDAVATEFVDGMNALQAQGRDLAGNEGAPMFEVGNSPTAMSVTLSDPRGIAAAGEGGGARDNSNLAALQTLRAEGKFETRVTDTVSVNAAALTARRTVVDAQTAIRDSAVVARDSVSGVNIDEEAVDLMRFQQAYQASSRVIQIARETLQTILDM